MQHVSQAAEQLNVSQPSVTIAIKKLEEEIGVKLLDRSQKRVTLTTEGRLFLLRVEDILKRLNDAVAEMKDYRELHKGSIRIGITPIMGAVLFPNAFASFQKRYPELSVTIMEEGSLSIRSRLEKGELDIGIMIISNLPSYLKTVRISRGQIMVCIPPGHSLAGHSVIPFQSLRNEPFILFREDTYSRQIILKECARCGFTPQVVFSSNQIGTIMGLVKQGVGIAFFIEEVIRLQEGIVSRPLVDPLYLVAGLAWNKKRYLPKAAQAFIDCFAEIH